MSHQELASPANSKLTVEPSVSAGLGYPNHRIDAPIAPTGWQVAKDTNLTSVGSKVQAPALSAESGS